MLFTILDAEAEKAAAAAALSASRLATLGEVSAGLAHELSQPLTVIALTAATATRECRQDDPGAPGRVADLMQTIVNMVTRARTITNHLRRFSRQEPVDRKPVRLAEVMDGARLLTGAALRDADVTLHVDIPASLPEVFASNTLLEQVLMNLLINARDAMAQTPPADRAVSVTARAELGHVIITVADTGPGIPEADLHRIFEPFFTTKLETGGTGLGLSICHGIVASFEGAIAAANRPEGGAEFTIILEAVPAELEAVP